MIIMKLEIGDFVEFKNYEDMTEDEKMSLFEGFFPKCGKVKKIKKNGYFFIEGCRFVFNPKSVARVISNANRFNPGDEILVKVTVKKAFSNYLQINSSIDDSDVVKVLKRKEPEYFIVQEDRYGMYIGFARTLVSDKSKAKLYASLDAANEAARDMQLYDWDVIPYGD